MKNIFLILVIAGALFACKAFYNHLDAKYVTTPYINSAETDTALPIINAVIKY